MDSNKANMMRNELYIDGKWVKPISGRTHDVINPATEEVFQTIGAASAEDVDIAVKAARRAFDQDGWPKLSGTQRGKYLRAIAAGILDRQEEIAR
jgi:betaine-aldehyde dehydrogenase